MKKVAFYFLISTFIWGCSINKLVIHQMEPILEQSSAALYEESDLELAEQALASNLKLVEGILKNDPQNEQLLLLAAQGYAGYALGFVEDENHDRAKMFYLRAKEYAFRVLRKDETFKAAENNSFEDLQKAVAGMDKKMVPALFWAGFSWAGYANLALNEPAAIAAVPKIQLLMDKVEELDPTFYYGAVYLYQGSIYGVKPVLIGGNPEKAKEYFEKNLELTKGKFLLTYIYMAKFYAAKVLDEDAFDKYLKHVLDVPVDIQPEITLLNRIAKKKAEILLQMKDELF
jgi:hypothetical protein